MASSMIHYIIANRIIKERKINDINSFLLGATLAPDASSHTDGSYDIADKYVRIHKGDAKKNWLQKGYRDYGRNVANTSGGITFKF